MTDMILETLLEKAESQRTVTSDISPWVDLVYFLLVEGAPITEEQHNISYALAYGAVSRMVTLP